MSESSQRVALRSSFRGGKSVTKKILSPATRISFRDLAKLAARRKTEQFLSDRTGCDERTAKRWLSGASRAPGEAVYVVLADIFSRID
jgi:hypothetical protein